MKNNLLQTIFITFSISLLFVQLSVAQVNFDDFFTSKTLRMDYLRAGTADTTFIFIRQFKEEPFWGGPRTNLIDPFNFGTYRLMVYDSVTNKLIYSKGYASLYREWQTTKEAKKTQRGFVESLIMPYPKNTIKIVLQARNWELEFFNEFEIFLNPENYFINEESPPDFDYQKIVDNGPAQNKVDIVFIPEGYTTGEKEKWKNDAKRFAGYLFNSEPFTREQKNFNIYRIDASSDESGTDMPGENIWKETLLNSSFYTFDSERYLSVKDIEKMRDVAAIVPYDQIYVITNSAKYGGGGIYNHYTLCSSDHALAEFLFVHEFGHGFAALADEYYTSDVSYSNFYNLEKEPYEVNITTRIDFDSKWKDLIKDGTPVPTPATKEYANTVGLFQGGGYRAKGIYRPYLDCTMKSAKPNNFCPICQRGIVKMIKYYIE